MNRQRLGCNRAVLVVSATLSAALLSLSASSLAVGAGPKYTLRLAHIASVNSHEHPSYVRLAEEVERITDGDVKVVIYPASKLGGNRENLQAVTMGTLEMAAADAGYLATYDPLLEVTYLPCLMPDEPTGLKATNGRVRETMAKHMLSVSNLRILGRLNSGTRMMLTKRAPVNEDICGLKLRVPESGQKVDPTSSVHLALL